VQLVLRASRAPRKVSAATSCSAQGTPSLPDDDKQWVTTTTALHRVPRAGGGRTVTAILSSPTRIHARLRLLVAYLTPSDGERFSTLLVKPPIVYEAARRSLPHNGLGEWRYEPIASEILTYLG